MEIVIRKNIEKYMQELKNWLDETATDDLEEMGDFFTARIGGYEQHMSIWEKAYQRMAELVPSECRKILDLGCGTGLELEAIWNRYSNAEITGVDLCQSMLEKLVKKYPDKPLRTVCEDYFWNVLRENRDSGRTAQPPTDKRSVAARKLGLILSESSV